MLRIIKTLKVRPIYTQPTSYNASVIFDIGGYSYSFSKEGGEIDLEEPIEYGKYDIHVKVYAYNRQPEYDSYHPTDIVWNKYDHHIEHVNPEILDVVFVEWDDDEKFSMIDFNVFVQYLDDIKDDIKEGFDMSNSWIDHIKRHHGEICDYYHDDIIEYKKRSS